MPCLRICQFWISLLVAHSHICCAASNYFLVAVMQDKSGKHGDKVVGYICGTLTAADHMDPQSISHHNPQGQTLCIHHVCVEENPQAQGTVLRMLKDYINMITQCRPQVSDSANHIL